MKRPCLQRCFLALALSLTLLPAYSQETGEWPQWRGPNRDGYSPATGLLKTWPDDGLATAWQSHDAGVGYSSLAIKNGRVFTQGDLDGIESIICLDAKDGRLLWAVQPAPVAKQLAERVEKEFKAIDADQDGVIQETEALKRFGWQWNKFNRPVDDSGLAQDRARALFEKLDANGDGKLTYAEAGKLLRDAFDRADATAKEVDAKELAASRAEEYMKLDQDGDKRLSKEEVKESELARRFDQFDEHDAATQKGDDYLTEQEIAAGLFKHEKGRDGVITLAELEALYSQLKPIGDAELSREELRSALGGFRDGNGDGPRSTPAVDEEHVYALGAMGDLSCLKVASGETVWHVNLVRDFQGQMPGSGYCESPLLLDDRLIVSPGGDKGAVVALDKRTGKPIWRSADVKERMDYASAVVGTLAGKQQIVHFSHESVFGLDLASGKLLWRYTAPASPNANCCTPILEDNFVFASSSYGTGGGLAEITNSDEGQEATEVYFQKKMTCHYGGMVKVGDCVYSNADGPLVCMDFATGKIRWQARSVGKGSILAADGMLYLVSEGNELALVEASPKKYTERGRFKAADQSRVLAHPAIAEGILLVRSGESITAYDVRDSASPSLANTRGKAGSVGKARR